MRSTRLSRRDFATSILGAGASGLLASTTVFARQGTRPVVNGTRLNAQVMDLRRFGGTSVGGTHRLGYSEEDKQARVQVAAWMREAGLTPRTDFAGNLIGRRAGRMDLPPLVFGSHIDSVPDGGSYDGNVGTMAAIEVARVLEERAIGLRHPIEVAVWANEESGLFGSRAVSGQFDPSELRFMTTSGKTVGDGIAFVGGDPSRLAEVTRTPGSIAAYLELHIEQGGILEATGTAIGVVEGIVGIRQWEVTVTGLANHAGTTPMDKRQDAMLAAARFIDMVNRVVRATPGQQVGTVGRLDASPGAVNVIPGVVTCSLELRDLDDAVILRLYDGIRAEATRIGDATGTTFTYAPLHENTPAPSDARMRASIGASAAALGLSTRVMPSGAGHDAQAMAQLGPMGMIFVPSIGGISHSPREFSRPDDVTHGANVLLGAVLAADAS